jgi:NADPH:quinone reductase
MGAGQAVDCLEKTPAL